jgi:hypothetical protein
VRKDKKVLLAFRADVGRHPDCTFPDLKSPARLSAVYTYPVPNGALRNPLTEGCHGLGVATPSGKLT